MKKYKLIKTYPTTSKTMKTGYEVKFVPSMGLYSHDLTLDTFTPQEVEENPEFWELVPVKNYEILEVSWGGRIYKSTGKRRKSFPSNEMVNVFIREGEVGIVTDEHFGTAYHNKQSGKYKTRISKVRRLTDGLIVEVGDYAIDTVSEKEIRVEEIIVDNRFIGELKAIDDNGIISTAIDNLEKSDRKYEISEEGLKIYVGDPYWFVWTSRPYEYHEILKPYLVDNYVDGGDNTSKSDNAKWFVKKKSAEAFVNSQIVFVSEDGFDVFRGQYYAKLELKTRHITDQTAIFGRDQEQGRENGELWFSSAGAAKEFLKERKPLFQTVQGKDIYEGDTYWCVNTAPHLWSIFEQTAKERTQLNKTVLAFDNEGYAKDYVYNFKPVYSQSEVEDLTYYAMKEVAYTPLSFWRAWADKHLKR